MVGDRMTADGTRPAYGEPLQRAEWQPKNNGAGKRIWFLWRDAPTIDASYRWSASGNLVRYATFEAALKAARRLNA